MEINVPRAGAGDARPAPDGAGTGAPPGRRPLTTRLIRFYYLATPVFLLLDLALGVNVRAAFLESPLARGGYYVLTFMCGLVTWRVPALAPGIARLESGANLALLIVGIYVPVIDLGNALVEGRGADPVLTPAGMTNAALSGVMFAISFYGNSFPARRR